VKAFIRRLNLDGVLHLEEAIGIVGRRGPGPDRESVARRMRDRVETSHPAFYREVEELLYEIRRRVGALRAARTSRAAWTARAAAAAGLLAAFAGTLPSADAAEPPPPQAHPPGDQAPPADSAILRDEFLGGAGGLVLMLVALPFAGKVRVDVSVDGEGKIRRAVVESEALEAPVKESAAKLLGQLYVRKTEAAGKRFVLELASTEIEALRASTRADSSRNQPRVMQPPPQPPLDPPEGNVPKEGNLDDVREALVDRMLGPASLVLYPGNGVAMEFWFDERGRVLHADAGGVRMSANEKKVLLQIAGSTYVDAPGVKGRRFRVLFGREEVERARESIRRSRTHICEYAPHRAGDR
jgi:hypothetical protein